MQGLKSVNDKKKISAGLGKNGIGWDASLFGIISKYL